jgi:hypothetical protein
VAFPDSITIGPYTFAAGEQAFADDASFISGSPTYIALDPGTSSNTFVGNTTTDLDLALTGSDITIGVDGGGIIFILSFTDNVIVNGPGFDLVVFEVGGAEPFEIALLVSGSLTSFQSFETSFTGSTVGEVVGTTNTGALNAAEIDLSVFGVAAGDTVSRIIVRSKPRGKSPGTFAGADLVAFGAFNSAPVPEPPTIPDDTMAPTGAVHAHGNIIWPGNNRMVTVTLEGHVVDEHGVSSAYLLVDGNEIILRRDGYPDLLGVDGSFSVTTEVEAVKGAVYNVELHATDNVSVEAGGPNSGWVDSTFIRVEEDKALLSPEDAAVLLFRRRPATFEWDNESFLADRIEFSAYPDFSRALSLAVESGATSWTADRKSWFKIKLLGIKGHSVYWRVIGTDPNGYIVQSEIFSFSFRRYFWWR